jgi:hypothetical protein
VAGDGHPKDAGVRQCLDVLIDDTAALVGALRVLAQQRDEHARALQQPASPSAMREELTSAPPPSRMPPRPQRRHWG